MVGRKGWGTQDFVGIEFLGRRLMVGQVPFHPTEPKTGSSGTPGRGFGSSEAEFLGRRLMVGQVPLEHFV